MPNELPAETLEKLLKQKMEYSEERVHCENCVASRYGGDEGFTLFCTMNPVANFKVVETGHCKFFKPKETPGCPPKI